MRFVDQFQALLFDMNGTFMFEHDRLGYEEDFFATYRKLGGTRLTAEVVRGSVLRTCSQLRRDYDDPACFESFPTLVDAVVSYGEVTAADAKDIANVIAEHEVGVVPRWAATALQCLSSTHPLALVSNVWSPEGHWIDELVRSDVARAFR